MAFERVDYFRARAAQLLLEMEDAGVSHPDKVYILLTAISAVADGLEIPTYKVGQWLREIRADLEKDRRR